MRISHESIFSGLNNIRVFDIFNDRVYTYDYGLTDGEIAELSERFDFDTNELRAWYNGIRINGQAIYNTYSVMSFIDNTVYKCFWGKSGTLEMITNLLTDERRLILTRLLNGEKVEVGVDDRISLRQVSFSSDDKAFYSLLVQAGYLSLDEYQANKDAAVVSIPNHELLTVWRNFIFGKLYNSSHFLTT